MSTEMQSLRKGFQDQLVQTNAQIQQVQQQAALLANKAEQLKGAIFALNALEEQLKASASKPEEVPPVAEATAAASEQKAEETAEPAKEEDKDGSQS
jgi:hypothetical protein